MSIKARGASIVVTGDDMSKMLGGWGETLKSLELAEQLVRAFGRCDPNCKGCTSRRSDIKKMREVVEQISKAIDAQTKLNEAKAKLVAAKLMTKVTK